MAIRGVFASDQHIVGNQRGDFASALLQTHAGGSAPLFALSSGMKSSSTNGSTVVNWFEEAKIIGRTAVVSGGTTTTLTVEDASSFANGGVLAVDETGEYMSIDSVAGNDITVTRGIAGTAITAVDNTMHVTRIGNAQPEGAVMPTAIANQGSARINWVQILANAWSVTGTMSATVLHTGSQIAKSKRDASFFHSEDIEKALIWGKMDARIGSNGQPLRYMEGIVSQIEKYGGLVEIPTDGQITQFNYRDFLRRIHQTQIKGAAQERMVFAGDVFLQNLIEAARSDASYSIDEEINEFGLDLFTFKAPGVRVKVLTHPLMVEHPVWTQEAYHIHPAAIEIRYHRRTFPEDFDRNGTRINGVDADQGVLRTELTITNRAPVTSGIMRGVVGFKPSPTAVPVA